MNQEDILALVRAGFSRSEILAMSQPAEPAPAEPQPDPEPAPQPDPEPAPAAPQPEPTPAAPQPAPAPQPSNQDVLAAIQGLTAAIQNINRNSAQQPGQSRITGDDVMAGFIRPPRPDNK